MEQGIFEKIFKEHIKIETSQKSIDGLFTPRMKNKTDYSPYYQRNYVWDESKATHFIESIFLGTELPPLIFFENEDGIEIIDGRQRYETIFRFMENEFSLKLNGLTVLTQLKNLKYNSLGKKSNDLLERFLECKIRIINFQIVNHPPLKIDLQDRIKKEIFLRYNSGITPLKREEVDDARYDKDELTNFFKKKLNNQNTHQLFQSTLFTGSDVIYKKHTVAKIMNQVRVELVLPKYPIEQFSKGGVSKIVEKLYEFYITNKDKSDEKVFIGFRDKLEFLSKVIKKSKKNERKVNHLGLRTLLWGIGILEIEGVNVKFKNDLIEKSSLFIDENINYFSTEYSTRRENIFNRYLIVQTFLENIFDVDLSSYISTNSKFDKVKKGLSHRTPKTKLEELNNLGLSKPEPSNMSIEDVVRKMNRRKFLVRPSYQRIEVINQQKKSSIIESILLNIKLPPIFIFKRLDDVYEVVDGQQRLLTLLSFIGESYTDQNDKKIYSKDNKFKLKDLRILSELNGLSFENLTDKMQDKLYDFQLYIVEIDSYKNPSFDPIDLFIRLNDKPYPIKQNSFEMWNSWVDKEIISNIKTLKNELYPWFHIKTITKKSDRDRMENEELITSFCYVEMAKGNLGDVIDVYQRDNIDLEKTITSKINARIKTKSRINKLLLETSKDEKVKKEFLGSIKNVKSKIKNLKTILIDRNPQENESLADFLKTELDKIVVDGNSRKLKNFYLIWILISKSNFQLVKFKRNDMKKDLVKMIKFYNKSHLNFSKDLDYNLVDKFAEDSKFFIKNYSPISTRKRKLTMDEKKSLLDEQGGKSSISGATMYIWDEIEVDHKVPISLQGKDEIENLGIAHKIENREKGSKL
ncbi:DUF262 domain-containing protein [Hyunsoonleella sp. SJ7]|uniref:DUF262 domain-containing protein n=1 Tax=Hyunsoonleella aquatilis TaxID=2762758 RepID=A0A923HDC2_9FLAO|nr:DUF262 domain-containing protein [Hyunsoonleella aquatilis]MBC3759852.1 DUF262 domain-containing protein [Hyunsoonleella aquatilis]